MLIAAAIIIVYMAGDEPGAQRFGHLRRIPTIYMGMTGVQQGLCIRKFLKQLQVVRQGKKIIIFGTQSHIFYCDLHAILFGKFTELLQLSLHLLLCTFQIAGDRFIRMNDNKSSPAFFGIGEGLFKYGQIRFFIRRVGQVYRHTGSMNGKGTVLPEQNFFIPVIVFPKFIKKLYAIPGR